MSENTNPGDMGPIGVIGLGNMGTPFSVNLIKAGFTVVGTDIVSENLKKLKENGGIPVNSCVEVGRLCRYIITSLPLADALQSVIMELGESCSKGTIVIESSTMSLKEKIKARELLAGKGVALLDAPVSGTGAQAVNKDIVVYASGDKESIIKCAPIFKGFSRLYYDLGNFGNGTYMKFVANQLVAIHNLAAAEAILLGVRCGLDAERIIEVISNGAGTSRMFEVRGPIMAKRGWKKAMITNRIFSKDLDLISEILKATGTPAPLFFASLPYYTAAIASGHAESDTSSIYEVLERMSSMPGMKNHKD